MVNIPIIITRTLRHGSHCFLADFALLYACNILLVYYTPFIDSIYDHLGDLNINF